MNKENLIHSNITSSSIMNESIQIIGNCVYLHSIDECGNCTQLIGELSEMSEQEKNYYGIK